MKKKVNPTSFYITIKECKKLLSTMTDLETSFNYAVKFIHNKAWKTGSDNLFKNLTNLIVAYDELEQEGKGGKIDIYG